MVISFVNSLTVSIFDLLRNPLSGMKLPIILFFHEI